MTLKVRKAVLPVAGLGTRMLPATKAVAKEMLPVFDRPVIQHVVEEAIEAGIEELIFVTGRGKSAIEDHFDRALELERSLSAAGKERELATVRGAALKPGAASFLRQQEPLGLGHAVWCARHLVGNEPFAVLLPDVIVRTQGRGCLGQLLDARSECGGNMIAVESVPLAMTGSYGIVGVAGSASGRTARVTAMVEKPQPHKAPSNLAILGRYVLEPEIFALLGAHRRGAGNEIQLTDAMQSLMATQPFHAFRHEGESFDCGTRDGFLLANVAYALAAQPRIGSPLRAEIVKLIAGGVGEASGSSPVPEAVRMVA